MNTVTKYPPQYVFCGNPIIFEVSTDSDALVTVNLTIGTHKTALTHKPFNRKVKFDISDYFRAFFVEEEIRSGYIFFDVANFEIKAKVQISGVQQEYNLTVFRGGVSLKLRKDLFFKQNGKDIFSYRLCNVENQFLFTTRTNGIHLKLKESEIDYPFIFISFGKTLVFTSFYGNEISVDMPQDGSIASFDIKALRAEFFQQYRELPSYIVAFIDGKSIFSITIEQSPISSEKYLLKFRNSLGAFELIELTGKAELDSFCEEKESYNVLSELDEFEEFCDRKTVDNSILVETGYKSKDELSFVLDMLQSDEIYFVNGEDQIRCFVTTESKQTPLKPTLPQSLSLIIRLAIKERFYSPEFVYPKTEIMFANITEPGSPELNSDGLIKTNENTFNAD